MNTPYIINYSNSVSCFPAIEIVTGQVRIQTNSFRLAVTGHARDILTILAGDYLLADTGDETSQVRRITGINTINRKIVIEEPFTVVPTDTVIRVVKVQSAETICVYNSGVADLYIDGEILASGDKLLWTQMTGEPPIVLYGTGDYQVSNGDIYTPVVIEPVGEALTRVNDTNVTLTLGGTPATALLEATSITVGWSGTLAPSRGGTGLDTSASTGFVSITGGVWSVLNASDFRTAIGAGTGSGTVTSVSGTADRITSSGGATPQIDIAATYVGQTSIVTVGTITTGTWSATEIALNKITAVTASRALVSDGSGFISASSVTATELGYLSGVTSAIQTQLDAKTGYVGTPVSINGQTAAIAATTFYTVGAADEYIRVGWRLMISTAGTVSSVLGPLQIKYTDATDNVVKTWPSNNSNGVNTSTQNSTQTVISGSLTLYAKTGTNVQYVISYTANAAASMEFSADFIVELIK